MTREGTSDKNLIERYRLGDMVALTQLVEKYHKVFCKKAYWVMKDKARARDVVQDCWLIIIGRLSDLRRAESFKSWALRIVYTKAIDAYKDQKKEAHSRTALRTMHSEQADIQDSEGLKERRLSEAIALLPKEKQDILRLFYMENYSVRQIGLFLQLPVGTVKSRLFNAREKLKSIIKTDGYEK